MILSKFIATLTAPEVERPWKLTHQLWNIAPSAVADAARTK